MERGGTDGPGGNGCNVWTGVKGERVARVKRWHGWHVVRVALLTHLLLRGVGRLQLRAEVRQQHVLVARGGVDVDRRLDQLGKLGEVGLRQP